MRWDWLGFREQRWTKASDEEVRPAKTLWDVLQLAIVPIALALIALAFNASQSARDQKHADQRLREDRTRALAVQRDTTLDNYFDKMANLMVNRRLLSSAAGDVTRTVARTLTLAALRRLDARRKAEVVNFLLDARLLSIADALPHNIVALRTPIVDLRNANLRGVDLRDLFSLGGQGASSFCCVSLAGADLRNARFGGINTFLVGIDFSGADLRQTHFAYARLRRVNLSDTRLDNASFAHASVGAARQPGVRIPDKKLPVFRFRGAIFYGACLDHASFLGATLCQVDVTGAQGQRVDFRKARFVNVNLQAGDFPNPILDGSTGMPSGWSSREGTRARPWRGACHR